MRIRSGIPYIAAFLGFVAIVWLPLALFSVKTAEELLRPIPIGSQLSDLATYIPRGWQDCDVDLWVPVQQQTAREQHSSPFRGVSGKVAFGHTWYVVKDIPGESIGQISRRRGRFTGEIVLYHDFLLRSEVVSLVYIDGKLRWKEWGYLPG